MDLKMESPQLFTLTSLASFLSVVFILYLSILASKLFLPACSSKKDLFTFIWLAFDALTHLIIEGSFLALSFPPPRTVNSSNWSPFKAVWL